VNPAAGIWAVLPVKEFEGAKQRLAPLLSPAQRQALAEIMVGEVLDALAAARGLAGILVVTCDPRAVALAARVGARVTAEGAREGHTGSVTAGIRLLTREGRAAGMLAIPGDIPAVTAAEIETVLAAHRPAPAFTIAPARDDLGSNAVLCSPPEAVALRFGDNSFFPHLDAARAVAIEPTVVRQVAGIAMDIDNPADLAAFLRLEQSARTRTRAFLDGGGLLPRLT
jgi:2-phospho-L-lactate/phosphoenolpyruvate guanylyltransferase